MNRLLINTANDELFIVLQKDNKIFSKTISSAMHHNETMLPEIDNLLKENNLEVNDINEYGVVIGPGSFTGIRVGISTIKAFRDVTGGVVKGINNLDYLFKLAQIVNPEIETVAIKGSRDSYFVAKLINDVVYKFERNLTNEELIKLAEGKSIGMFKKDEDLNCVVVKQNAETLIDCFLKSCDEKLIPVYYQLSQAENEKIKRSALKIRKICKKDFVKISTLEKENISTNAMTLEQIESYSDNENLIGLKSVVDNEIVGFILLQKTDELNIDSVVVKKEFRNFGVATKMIEKAKVLAKKNKIGTLSLEVNDKNITAYLLYKKLGFAERRVRKCYYADGGNAIEMIKKI